MKSLRKLLMDDAATGSVSGGDVAGVRAPLFSAPIKRESTTKKKTLKVKTKGLRESLLGKLVAEASDETFKSIDVISKLKDAEKKFEFDKDTVAFGIEVTNDNGEKSDIKVYVKAAQAEEFERRMSEIIKDEDASKEDIAATLYNMKDVGIVNIEGLEVEEDQEEIVPPEEGDMAPDDELGAGEEGMEGGEDELGMEDDMGEEDLGQEDGVKSALDKVIDMLKADAEAKKAEAQAKEAEARAKEAEYAAKAAESKMKSEEEVLDMEAHFKQQSDEKKEAQKLAKMARFRHEKAQDGMEGGDL